MQLTKIDDTIKQIVNKTFPEYHGKKFRIEYRDKISFSGAYWSGGSKSSYAIVKLDTLENISIPDAPFLQQSDLHDNTHPLPAGYIVVEHDIFCGKDMGLIFYLNPSHSDYFIQEKVELSKQEIIVLVATRSLKSSYAGISNYRFYSANRETGISLQEWNDTKQSLISSGMLNKAGAITPDGKNAIDGIWNLYELK